MQSAKKIPEIAWQNNNNNDNNISKELVGNKDMHNTTIGIGLEDATSLQADRGRHTKKASLAEKDVDCPRMEQLVRCFMPRKRSHGGQQRF